MDPRKTFSYNSDVIKFSWNLKFLRRVEFDILRVYFRGNKDFWKARTHPEAEDTRVLDRVSL